MNVAYFVVQQTMYFAIPLLIVAIGAMYSERSGVINIALEGICLLYTSKDNPESWKAFLRRIHEVTIYKEDGTLTHYDSVEAYLKRKEKFHTIEPDEECPFAEQETLDFEG